MASLFRVSYKTVVLYDTNGQALKENNEGGFEADSLPTGATLLLRTGSTTEPFRNNCATASADALVDRLKTVRSVERSSSTFATKRRSKTLSSALARGRPNVLPMT